MDAYTDLFCYFEVTKPDTVEYELYCKNVKLCEFTVSNSSIQSCNLMVKNKNLLPPNMKFGNSVTALQTWLLGRHLDFNRTNGRALLKALDLARSTNVENVLANHSLVLTDCYWTKRVDENLPFEEVSLYRKKDISYIVDISLSGIDKAQKILMQDNPEVTNIGSFNKAWRYIDGEWRLYKRGSKYNYFVELLYYKIGKAMSVNIATYKFDTSEGMIYSKNVTNEETALNHMALYGGKKLEPILLEMEMFKKDYIKMLLLDAMLLNYDRHEYNYGILTDTTTGVLKGLAPLFDHNLCLGVLDKTPEQNFSLTQLKMQLQELGNNRLTECLDFMNSFTKINVEALIADTVSEVGLEDEKYIKNLLKYFDELTKFIKNIEKTKNI